MVREGPTSKHVALYRTTNRKIHGPFTPEAGKELEHTFRELDTKIVLATELAGGHAARKNK